MSDPESAPREESSPDASAQSVNADADANAETESADADVDANAESAGADVDANADIARSVAEADATDASDLLALGDKDAVFDALWGRVLEAWDDDKPHAALLEHALKSEKLPDLAGRYRALKDDPEKGARAQKKIDGVVIAATHMLMAMKTPVRTKLPWQWSASAGLFFVIVCAWLFYQLFLPHRR